MEKLNCLNTDFNFFIAMVVHGNALFLTQDSEIPYLLSWLASSTPRRPWIYTNLTQITPCCNKWRSYVTYHMIIYLSLYFGDVTFQASLLPETSRHNISATKTTNWLQIGYRFFYICKSSKFYIDVSIRRLLNLKIRLYTEIDPCYRTYLMAWQVVSIPYVSIRPIPPSTSRVTKSSCSKEELVPYATF